MNIGLFVSIDRDLGANSVELKAVRREPSGYEAMRNPGSKKPTRRDSQ